MAGFAVPIFTAFSIGQVAAGGSANVYQTGTTTPVTLYSDGLLTTPITNPVTLDQNGEAVFYVTGTTNLRIDYYTAAGGFIKSIDPVYPVSATSSSSSSGIAWTVASGTSDVIVATYTPIITTLTDGLLLSFRANAANTTTSPTFNPNALGAASITQRGGAPLIAGNISAILAEYIIRYNLANTRWELLNPTVISSGALTLISTQTITTAVANVDFTGIDGTYKHYILEITNLLMTTNGDALAVRLQQSGSFVTSSNYDYGESGRDSNAGTIANSAIAASSFAINAGNGQSSVKPGAYIIDLFQPALVISPAIGWRVHARGASTSNRTQEVLGTGALTIDAAYTGIRFLTTGASTMAAGTFKLYGLA